MNDNRIADENEKKKHDRKNNEKQLKIYSKKENKRKEKKTKCERYENCHLNEYNEYDTLTRYTNLKINRF